MRLRFAPSPTGYLHIGNARTAIINYLVARKTGATLVLRIEDTDMERSSIESERSIMSDLKWLGVRWDEGPDAGGSHGPYRQSERFDIYRSYTEKLIAQGDAYHCYCTKEELEAMKKGADGQAQYEYNGHCRSISAEQLHAYRAEGRKPTVRFRVPPATAVELNDHLKGRIVFNSDNVGGDFIIVRSDGVPVYNYIVVIDDALMEVSHVIRGEDHLSNTPKQLLIGRALGLPAPEYAHLPLVLGQDRAKLSKRHGITSVDLYRQEGYLPDSLVNYLALLGWAPESGAEILTIEEIIREIDLDGLGKSAAIFDFQKLRWMNGQYIRQLPENELNGLFAPYITKAGYDVGAIGPDRLTEIIMLLRGNCEVLSDIGRLIGIFLDDLPEPDEEASRVLAGDESKAIIRAAHGYLAAHAEELDSLHPLTSHISAETGIKGKKFFFPLRAMVTSRVKGPDLDRAFPLIGQERIRKRIQHCYERFVS